jgi:very-short-patch-repair endonuclease
MIVSAEMRRGGSERGHVKKTPSPLAGEGGEGGHPRTLVIARKLRAEMTDAEKKLWSLLRRKQLAGFRFRRQVPLGPFIADFACHSARMIVEVDGGQHGMRTDQDERRTKWLQQFGWRVLRFWNADVLRESENVLEMIRLALIESPPQPSARPPSPTLPRKGGGRFSSDPSGNF